MGRTFGGSQVPRLGLWSYQYRSLFDFLTMALPAVVLLMAAFACRAEAGCPSGDRACAAYFRSINLDPSMFAAGKVWRDQVCCFSDPSKYFECEYCNGVFTSETRQCPAGQLFNWGAKQPWERTCVPVNKCSRKECPNWMLYSKPIVPKQPTVTEVVTSGTHGCIDCVIGKCHQCLCQEALKTSTNGVANVVDPNNKAGNQYLVCEGTRITCHPCPKGLVWDCVRGVCATTGSCPPIPTACRCDCGMKTKLNKMLTTETTSTQTTITTTGITVTATTSTTPAPVAYIKEYTTKTTVVCTETSIAPGGQVQVPCGQLPSSTTSLKHAVPKTETKTVVTPSRNVTVTTVRDPCKTEAKTSTESSCVGSCPATTTTVSVSPSTDKWVGPINRDSSPVTTTPIVPSDMTKKQCICEAALKRSGATSVFVCDPYAADRFLVCQLDQWAIVSEPCAFGTAWDDFIGRCTAESKCRPIPAHCSALQ